MIRIFLSITMKPKTAPNNCVQATQVCACFLFLRQRPGAPDADRWARLMKTGRLLVFCCWVVSTCSMWSGCATSRGSYEQQMRAEEENEAWRQMTFCEKTGGVLLFCLQGLAYGMGSSNFSFQP